VPIGANAGATRQHEVRTMSETKQPTARELLERGVAGDEFDDPKSQWSRQERQRRAEAEAAEARAAAEERRRKAEAERARATPTAPEAEGEFRPLVQGGPPFPGPPPGPRTSRPRR
jgi:hypothetical protein